MVNVLIADDNIHFATSLMNYINEKNSNIRVCCIAEDGQKAINLLNGKEPIDVILLDYKMPIYDGKEVLNKVENKQKYEKSCIIISGEYEIARKMIDNEMIYKVLNKTLSLIDIIENINELIEYKESKKLDTQINNKIIKELLFLGYNISHNGTKYLLETIQYIYSNKDQYLDNFTKSVYPIIASKYHKSVHNIKCSIERETNEMYFVCQLDILKDYFHFYDDNKPNVKMVINTIINKII